MSDAPSEDSPKTPVVYANHVTVGLTVYDLSLAFGLGADESVDEQVVVHMSPQHARSLQLLLERFLRGYEEQVGPVVLPEQLVRRLKGEAGDDDEDSEAN